MVMLFIFLALVCSFSQALPSQEGPVVNTDLGAVQGYFDDKNQVNVFRGIPFAAPPVGDLRFRRPQPAASWSGVRPAVSHAHICPQVIVSSLLFLGQEDCLYLDVYVPVNVSASIPRPLPVLVWIYGGGYGLGDGWEFGFYDGSHIAADPNTPKIVVTFNYRLASLGFMALDEIAEDDNKNEQDKGLYGSMGIHDQRAALEWVSRNILSFGGSPDRVTIAGESAGAFSVCFHLVSPGSRSLFHGAILESGTCSAPEFFVAQKNSVSFSRAWSTLVGCDATTLKGQALLTCLRGLDTKTIMGWHIAENQTLGYSDEEIERMYPEVTISVPGQRLYTTTNITLSSKQQLWSALMREHTELNWPSGEFKPALYPHMPWGPTIDGHPLGLPSTPLSLLRSSSWNRVPVLMGMNNDEGNIFVPELPSMVPSTTFPLRDEDLTPAFLHFFDDNETTVNAILNEYPAYEYKFAEHRAAIVLRDYMFVCSAQHAQLAIHETSPVWSYHFTYPGDFIESPFLHDYHTAELPFVFNNEWPPFLHTFSAVDKEMSAVFVHYWGNFVHYGNPNGNITVTDKPSSFMTWTQFDDVNMKTAVLDIPTAIETHFNKDRCEFWDKVQKNQL